MTIVPDYADADRAVAKWCALAPWLKTEAGLRSFVRGLLDAERASSGAWAVEREKAIVARDTDIARLAAELADARAKLDARGAAIEAGESNYQRALRELAEKDAECERLRDVVRDLREADITDVVGHPPMTAAGVRMRLEDALSAPPKPPEPEAKHARCASSDCRAPLCVCPCRACSLQPTRAVEQPAEPDMNEREEYEEMQEARARKPAERAKVGALNAADYPERISLSRSPMVWPPVWVATSDAFASYGYVRADIHNATLAALARAEAERDEAVTILRNGRWLYSGADEFLAKHDAKAKETL